MSTSQNLIIQLYNSRKNILEILNQVYSYDITDYDGFSTNEIDTMQSNTQLDMLLTKTVEGVNQPIHKTYIHYSMKDANETKFNPINRLSQVIEDLYVISDTLSKEDCLIMIFPGEPNDAFMAHLEQLYQNEGIFVVAINMQRLQFNILNHHLVPKVEILSSEDIDALKEKYHISTHNELPEISRFDPQALAICLRPGKICKFIRKSPTALEAEYYRVCV